MTGIYWVAYVLCMKLNGYRDNGEVVKNELLIATYILQWEIFSSCNLHTSI